MKQDRWKLHLAVAAVAIAAMTMALTPAVADPVPDTEEYPDVAFLARNDVPFDAQTAASMAAQLGAPMFITNPGALSDAAANGISELDPDVLIVAGGEFAISDDVANAAAAECDPDCTVDRRFGAGRDQTAAALAEIAADYGFDRPVLQGSNHVVGDVHVRGTVSANALTVEDTGLVSDLNADRVDGMDSSAFAEAGHDHQLMEGFLDTAEILSSESSGELLSLTVSAGDPCGGGTTQHTYVGNAVTGLRQRTSGPDEKVFAGIRIAGPGESINVGTGAGDRGLSRTVLENPSTTGVDIQHVSARRVFTGVGPGDTELRLLYGKSGSNSIDAFDVTFTVEHRGYECP